MLLRKIGFRLAAVVAMFAMLLVPGVGANAMGGGGDNSYYAWNSIPQFAAGRLDGGAKMGVDKGRAEVTLHHGQNNGVWTAPVLTLKQPSNQINPSWQTTTPYGSHIEVEMKVLLNGQWSNWYQMGKWGKYDTSAFTRTSVNGQHDQFGDIWTDTYNAPNNDLVTAYQLRVKLVSEDGKNLPHLYQLAVQASTYHPFSTVSKTTMTSQILLNMTPYSQYVHDGEFTSFGGGGEAWCSPTSVAMTMSHWGVSPTAAEIATLPYDPLFELHGKADPAVDYEAVHSYDLAYDGTGNWPFSTALPAEYGLDTSVRQANSLVPIEDLVKHNIPAVLSVAWDNTDSNPDNDLPGASIAKTPGHLFTVAGFTKNGDVIVYDPASPAGDSQVPHVYPRKNVEQVWLNPTGGIYYRIGGPVARH